MVAKSTTSSTASRTAKSVTAVGASGGSAVADIKAAVGTSTSPTSTGTKAVTGVGFRPKAVMPFGVPRLADGADGFAIFTFGAGVSPTSRASVGVGSQDGTATSNTDRGHYNNAIFSQVYNGTTYEQADLDSIDSDGYTFDWVKANSFARIFNHICLGGDDLEVSLTQHQMNGTNADESFAHGLTGGAPDALLFFGVNASNGTPGIYTQAIMECGAWADGSQFRSAVYSRDNVVTSLTKRELRNDGVCGILVSTASQRLMAVSSVDSGNVNVTYPITSVASANYFFMLALRGCKAQVGTFDGLGAGSNSISCPGITPKLLLWLQMREGVQNINSTISNAMLTIGAADGTNMVSCGITDQDAVSTTNSRRFQESGEFREYDIAGNLRFRADGCTFSQGQVDINVINANTNHDEGAYLIIGA